ncbi:MAG: hypothetical protein HFJ65_03685 [Eggerthellaceae bacterium]|nr:hypothetical protein [Eggerthellaceae bacterium]
MSSASRQRLVRFFNGIPRAFWLAFLAYIAITIALNVCVAPFVHYRHKAMLASFGFIFLPLGLALGCAGCLLARKLGAKIRQAMSERASSLSSFATRHAFGIFVGICTVVLFAIQLMAAHGCNPWSRGTDFTQLQVFGNPTFLSAYLSIYPNNQFICGVYYIIHQICGVTGMDDPYLATIYVGCASVALSCAAAAFIARRIGGNICGACTYLVLFAFVGLDPNILIPYTDAYGMIFVTGTLLAYACGRGLSKWPLMVLLTYMGYSMKPIALAAFAGCALVSICTHLANWLEERRQGTSSAGVWKERAGKFAKGAACCILAFAVSFGAVSATKGVHGLTTHPEEALSPAHFLMMGFNAKYDGTYNFEDIDQSFQFHSPQEMYEADMAVWKTRVRMLGPVGVAELMVKKNLINYNSGVFAYSMLHYIQELYVLGDNELIQGFYGVAPVSEGNLDADSESFAPSPYECGAQAIWFMVLAGIVLGLLRKRPTGVEMAISIALLMVSVFLLLFEPSARYLYIYSPLFVVLGVRGWQALGRTRAIMRKDRNLN